MVEGVYRMLDAVLIAPEVVTHACSLAHILAIAAAQAYLDRDVSVWAVTHDMSLAATAEAGACRKMDQILKLPNSTSFRLPPFDDCIVALHAGKLCMIICLLQICMLGVWQVIRRMQAVTMLSNMVVVVVGGWGEGGGHNCP